MEKRDPRVGCYAFISTADLLDSAPIAVSTPEDEARLAALVRTRDREDYIAARILTRLLLSRCAGVEYLSVRIRQRYEACDGSHGKPEVIFPTGYHVSWAHHQGFVAAAAANSDVGIDLIARTRSPWPTESWAVPGIDPGDLSKAEALFKAGVGDSLDQLLTLNYSLNSAPFINRRNRCVRLRRHSTDDVEVCVASAQDVLPVSVHGLLGERT